MSRQGLHPSPPAIVMGGGANSISVARSLGRAGIKVYALCGPHDHVRYSRFCEWIPIGDQTNQTETWARYLSGPESDHLSGAVLLAAGDAAIETIAARREILSSKFRLDISDREAQLAMLDKLATYTYAVKAGVNTPRFWPLRAREDLFALKDELVFPLLLKPLKSIEFGSRLPGKHFVAHDFPHLLTLYERVRQAGVAVMLVEQVPGPDERLCSYYTYIDESGRPAFDFTKRVIRRFPLGMGLATYHVTDWNPEVREQALKFFQAVGLRGVANAEFKFDERDGQLKLIECNARFTAANSLLTDSGFDLALFVYYRLIGKPYHLPKEYETGKRLWYPVRDFLACKELKKRNEITFTEWARSVIYYQSFPYFKLQDPLPSIMTGLREISQFLARRFKRTGQSLGSKMRWAYRATK